MIPEKIGKYRILHELGRGGMGVVYLSEDAEAGRKVALKTIAERYLDRDDAQRRFQNEIRAAARLEHPNIVTVYDLVLDGSPPFYTMRFVDGTPLSKLLSTGWFDTSRSESAANKMASTFELLTAGSQKSDAIDAGSPRTAVETREHADPCIKGRQIRVLVEIFAKVARALAYAHSAGVIHRDVKPANILIDRTMQPHVADFGLAHLDQGGAVSETEGIIGTPEYLPPERLNAGVIDSDHRADIYSLGISIFEIVAGRRPFSKSNRDALYRAILFERAPLLRKLNPDAPRDLEVIVSVCLEKNPDDRYASMARIAEDLEALLDLRPIGVRKLSWPMRSYRAVMRRKALSAVAAAAILCLVSLAGLLVDSESDRRRVAGERKDLLAARGLRETIERPYPLSPASRERLHRWLDATQELLVRYPRATRSQIARDETSTSFDEGAALDFDWLERRVEDVKSDLRRIDEDERRWMKESQGKWDDTIAAVAQSPRYDGFRLTPIRGLVPLGRNEASGLEEFWVVATGEAPSTGRTGGAVSREKDGVVLVLLPGGTFTFGAPASNPTVRKDCAAVEQPQTYSMPPILVSKYETTSEQFRHIMGFDPTIRKPTEKKDVAYPVTEVSCIDAESFAKRAGLELPDEAEWEFACRAGSDSDWSFGNDPREMIRFGNICDMRAKQAQSEKWDDGFGLPAPVGSFLANAFGLHDCHGNVAEWCRDIWRAEYARTDEIAESPRTLRAFRGGNSVTTALQSRSGFRSRLSGCSSNSYLGLRPVLRLSSIGVH